MLNKVTPAHDAFWPIPVLHVCTLNSGVGYSSSPQESIRRLLSTNDASSEFNTWCEQELRKFNTDVDGMCGGASYPDCVAFFLRTVSPSIQLQFCATIILQFYSCTCMWSHSQAIHLCCKFQVGFLCDKTCDSNRPIEFAKTWPCVNLIGKFYLTFLDNL